jgi:hypothetical protein
LAQTKRFRFGVLSDIDWGVALTFLIRTGNALLWTVFVLQTIRSDRPLLRTARLMILPVIFMGMWVLVIGSLVTLGILSGDVARTVYTLFTAFAAIVALTLVTSDVASLGEDDKGRNTRT